MKEDFLALLIIKENENLCFNFDHKKISFFCMYFDQKYWKNKVLR